LLNESISACRLEDLTALQQHVAGRLQELGVAPELGQSVQAAAAKAFSAVCLSRPESNQVRTSLETTRGELCLRLMFNGEEEPAGLAAALYCPPALRVAFRQTQGWGIWTAFWEG
jgi:hypothetical protein